MESFGKTHRVWMPYACILAVIVLRIGWGHPYNFVPVFAALLFFAAERPAREFALALLPLICADIYLTVHQYGYALTLGAAVTWIWYLIAMLMGSGLLRGVPGWRRVAGTSLAASASYFVASNFTVWAEWNMYPRTAAGLTACYVNALPFFRNGLGSELVCSVLLFGLNAAWLSQSEDTAKTAALNAAR